MRKTGEAYTAARAHIVKAPRPPVALVTTAPAPAPERTATKVDYAKLAGMADAKVEKATGCNWERWVYALDRKKAYQLSHRDLAKLIREKYKTPDWWTQTVAVGYERIKGKRTIGQRGDGRYHATKSRTFHVSVEELYDAWASAPQRAKWLGDKNVKVRTAKRPQSLRLEQDGSIIAVWFMKKSPTKSAVAVDEDKLPSKEAADAVKKYWGERLDDLAALLSA
jgi:hypothetical protein